MRMSREDNESAPNLYIEFESDDDAAPHPEGGLVSEREAIGVAPRGWVPHWRPGSWSSMTARYRRVAAGTVVLLGLGSATGGTLAAQAAQRASGRPTLAIVDAAYAARTDGAGLDLLVNLGDPGRMSVTVTQARVQQPGVDLHYAGPPMSLPSAEQLELVLSGSYNCLAAASPSTPATSFVHLTVNNVHGTVSTIDLALPASARLPGHWRGGRAAAYCAWNR